MDKLEEAALGYIRLKKLFVRDLDVVLLCDLGDVLFHMAECISRQAACLGLQSNVPKTKTMKTHHKQKWIETPTVQLPGKKVHGCRNSNTVASFLSARGQKR